MALVLVIWIIILLGLSLWKTKHLAKTKFGLMKLLNNTNSKREQSRSYPVVFLLRSVMKTLQERAKDFVVIAAAQDTLSDNTDVVLYLLMLISEIQNEDES